jgi:carbamoyltransferase
MTSILGINAYHGDSAACLVRDGQLVAAAEEERFRRIKHWAGLPTEAIAYCLREGGIQFGDLDQIAINRQPAVNNWRRLLFVLRHRPDFGLIRSRLRNRRHAASIEEILGKAFPGQPIRASVHHVEHHLAHLGSAFLVSPFEEAVCLSADGFGDFASAAWGMGRGGDIGIDGRIYFPHSLGIFYSAITQLIGFPYFGDEYKVMGLAPYGEPRYLAQMRRLVRVKANGTYELDLRFFRHHTDNVTYSWQDCAPEVGTLYTPALEDLLGPARKQGEPLVQKHKDLARSAQALYEEAFFALLNELYKKYQCPNLALSGGCAMNSVANGKVYLNSPFKKMYLPAAAGDAGGAIGAAFVVWNQLNAETPKSRNTETPSGSVTQLSTLPNSTPRSTLHASRCPTPTPALGTMTPR